MFMISLGVAEASSDLLWRAWLILLVGGGVVVLSVSLVADLLYLLSRFVGQLL